MPKKNQKEIQMRKNVTFTEMQVELIKIGVDLGMALNEAEYIRRAVDEFNEKIPIYQKIKEYINNNEEIDKQLEQLGDN